MPNNISDLLKNKQNLNFIGKIKQDIYIPNDDVTSKGIEINVASTVTTMKIQDTNVIEGMRDLKHVKKKSQYKMADKDTSKSKDEQQNIGIIMNKSTGLAIHGLRRRSSYVIFLVL